MSIFRLPSDLEIWSCVLTNFWPPFMYVWDIVKDTVQLSLMVIVVGGYENVFKYWSSFSSVVSHVWQDNLQMNSYHISANSFLPSIVSVATIQFMKKKIAIMRKLYENFHIFHFQKRIVSAETIRGNTVCKEHSLRTGRQMLCSSHIKI